MAMLTIIYWLFRFVLLCRTLIYPYLSIKFYYKYVGKSNTNKIWCTRSQEYPFPFKGFNKHLVLYLSLGLPWRMRGVVSSWRLFSVLLSLSMFSCYFSLGFYIKFAIFLLKKKFISSSFLKLSHWFLLFLYSYWIFYGLGLFLFLFLGWRSNDFLFHIRILVLVLFIWLAILIIRCFLIL